MRFLIDEMFPPTVAARLRELHHDAVHVRDRGLDARADPEVAALAADERRVLVTENVKDFARCESIAVICVLNSRLRSRGMAEQLATTLDRWADQNPEPYLGLHWPVIGRGT